MKTSHSIIVGSLLCALLGVSSAQASGKKKPEAPVDDAPVVVVPPVVDNKPIVTDPVRYQQGRDLGLRNGTLIAKRLKDRTIGLQGCAALEDYQQGLLQVSRSVQAPGGGTGGSDLDITRGFFKGYLDAVRNAIRTSRHECQLTSFDQGHFVGELYGSLLCQISKISVDVITGLEIESLGTGWSGESSTVIEQCHQSADLVIRSCGTDLSSVVDSVTLAIDLSCND